MSFQDLKSLEQSLTDHLLPEDSSLRQFSGRSASQHIWYRLGKGAKGWLVGEEPPDRWRSLVEGSSVAKEQTPLRDLAEKLWEIPRDLAEPLIMRRLLAVADPVSNTLTLIWRIPTPDDQNEASWGASCQSFIAELLESFLTFTRSYEDKVVRRPTLSVVFAADDEAPQGFLQAILEIFKQVGLYLADFQIRWLRRGSAEAKAFLKTALLFHMPWPVWPDPGTLISNEDLQNLSGQITSFSRFLRFFEEELEAGTSPFRILGRLLNIREAKPTIFSREDPERTSLATSVTQPASQSFLHLRLSARRWHDQKDLDLPLAPLTLLCGNNAEGKTTIAEALCMALTGLPRPRARLPVNATEWESYKKGRLDSLPPPKLVLKRIEIRRLETFGTEASSDLQPGQLLPLFADDADLTMGTAGELAVVTWLPFPGLAGSSGDSSTGPGLVEIVQLMHRIRARLSQLADAVDHPATSSPEADTVRLGLSLKGVFRDVLNQEIEQLEAYLQKADENQKELEDKLKEEDNEALRRQLQELGGQIDGYEDDIKQRRKLLSEVRGSGENEVEIPADQLVGLLCEELVRLGPWKDEILQDLESLDRGLGGASLLRSVASERMRQEWKQIERDLETFFMGVADALFKNKSFEEDLEDFLSLEVAPTRASAGARQNTASVVRIGQASRLARWLTCGQVDWPFLVVDEPTLGQDDASCARALARLLRLLRKVETHRWADWSTRGNALAPEAFLRISQDEKILEDGRREDDTDSGHEQHPWTRRSAPDLPWTPQALILSYRETALSAVSDLEGTVLNDRLRQHLRRLVPRVWWGVLAASLRQARDAARQDLQSSASPLPTLILRTHWQPPFRETVELKDSLDSWKRKASCSLEQLGLPGMAAAIAQEDNLEKRHEKAWRLMIWLCVTDLLPAALADGERCFMLAGISHREIPLSGLAEETGPVRLRRVGPFMDALPDVPPPWNQELEEALSTLPTQSSEEVTASPKPQRPDFFDEKPPTSPAGELGADDAAERRQDRPSSDTQSLASEEVDDAADKEHQDTVDEPYSPIEKDSLDFAPISSSHADLPEPEEDGDVDPDMKCRLEEAIDAARRRRERAKLAATDEPGAGTLEEESDTREPVTSEDTGKPAVSRPAAEPDSKESPRTDQSSPPDIEVFQPVAPGLWRVSLTVAPAQGVEDRKHLETLRRELRWAGFINVPPEAVAECHVEIEPEEASTPSAVERAFSWRLAGQSLQASRERASHHQALEDLLESLVADRASMLVKQRPDEPIPMILASYNPNEMPVSPAAFRLVADPLASDLRTRDMQIAQAMKQWQGIFVDGLTRFRRALAASPATRTIRLYPKCTPSTALRAGAIFHRASGFKVQCDQAGTMWSLDVPADPSPGIARLTDSGTGHEKKGGELHILISIAQNVEGTYQQWRDAEGVTPQTCLHFQPVEGIGRNAIRSPEHAVGWAEAIYTELVQKRESPATKTRFFFAGPVGVAVALGRQLNAIGHCVAMDVDTKNNTYFEAFSF